MHLKRIPLFLLAPMQSATKRQQGLSVFLLCLLAASIPYTIHIVGGIVFFCALYALVLINFRKITSISGQYIKKWPGRCIIFALVFVLILLLSALKSKDSDALFGQLNNILSGVAVFLLIMLLKQDDRSLVFVLSSFLFSGMVCAATEIWRVARFGGACGYAWNPNVFGGYLVTLTPVAIGGFFAARNWVERLFALAAAGLTGAAIFFSLCRGSLVSVFLALLLLVWWLRRFWLLPIGLACVGILHHSAPLSLARFGSLLRGVIDTTTEQRFILWSAAWQLFKERPILGWGTGNYCLLAPGHGLSSIVMLANNQSRSCHNSYLELLAEQGAVGLAAFLLIWAAALIPIFRYLFTAGKKCDVWLAAMTAGIGAFLMQNITNSLFLHSSISLSAWLLLGLCVNRYRNLAAAGTQ